MMTELEIAIDEALGPRHPGEYELKKYLRRQGNEVLDVSENPVYWAQDIDFIVNDMITVEVKWDEVISSTGNLFIEFCADINKDTPGWFTYCKADWLYYGDAVNKKYYIFPFNELKQHIEKNIDQYKIGTAADRDKRDNVKKWSRGYLVPLNTVEHLYSTLLLEE